jgi:hypothetical protein
MFNLFNVIPAEDKVKIHNYINAYGVYQDKFLGDEWFSDWSKNKIKLYKLLGNNLIYKKSIKIKKSKDLLGQQIDDLRKNHWDFIDSFYDLSIKISKDYGKRLDYDDIYCIVSFTALLNNSTCYTIKVDKKDYPEKKKKSLQIQKGTKCAKGINTILNYFEEDYPELIGTIRPLFEKFRIDYSMVFNDDTINGNLVISIHPLDYMTMSDNDSNWQSCMSWRADGCYHVGTVEMMNSNNVLCCYLENDKPFDFDNKKIKEGQKEYLWSNKRWRELVYITMDIIVGGKAYPFASDDLSKELIQTVRELAAKNWKRTYHFGPELYQDMKYINNSYSMDRAKGYIRYGNTKKHNILFDSKGMYHDMINDSATHYWCVRNKVDKTKVISYSGKAPCLCCGKNVLVEDNPNEYNDRYDNVGSVICRDCQADFTCDICDGASYTEPMYTIRSKDGRPANVCRCCYDAYIKECPNCGKPFSMVRDPVDNYRYNEKTLEYFVNFDLAGELSNDVIKRQIDYNNGGHKIWHAEEMGCDFKDIKEGISVSNYVFPVCACSDCLKKKNELFKDEKISSFYGSEYVAKLTKEPQNPEDWEKYMWFNLKPAKYEKDIVVDTPEIIKYDNMS